MGKKTALGLAVLLIVATLMVGLLSTLPQGRGQPQPPPTTTEEKLNQILTRLDKIEKRLAELTPQRGPSRAGARTSDHAAAAAPSDANVASALPCDRAKQKPRSSTFKNCAPQGVGGDPDLNSLKNRIDDSEEWIPVSFDAVLNHPFPATVGKVDRADWDMNDMNEVKKCEGLPISIICYITAAELEGEESCNCGISDQAMYDIHVWLTKEPLKKIEGKPDRRQAVVAEVTPRLKIKHGEWTPARLKKLARDKTKVRISGWLLLDQEHPEHLKPATNRKYPTRGTLWEIHPIMEIEVWQDGEWVPLDDLQSSMVWSQTMAA
jgi:hypothetical protein